jgi:NAD dependent epimerase/dehydratase family enzyme
MSWVARTDTVRALQVLVEHPQISGVANVTAPEPVRNADFTRHLAAALHRPAIAVVPGFGIRLLYGEMGMQTVVAGQRVLPRALLAAGFVFSYPELGSALRHELATSDSND